MVATMVAEEVHTTEFVRSRVLLSLYTPVAVNCRVFPTRIEAVAGAIAIETSVGGSGAVTVRDVVHTATAGAAYHDASMVVVPCEKAWASPVEPMVATLVFVESHPTILVTFCVLPSL